MQDSFVAMHGALADAARAREGRWPTCARRWSTGPARCCGTAGVQARTSRRSSATSPAPTTARARRRAARAPCSTRCAPLPDRQREVLALRYYLDLSEADIADDPRHQPRGREEPRVARRRRPALPDGGRLMNTDDDQVRALLDDAVSDVEPRARSTRSGPGRPRRPRRRRPWVWGARRRRRSRPPRRSPRSRCSPAAPVRRTRDPARAGDAAHRTDDVGHRAAGAESRDGLLRRRHRPRPAAVPGEHPVVGDAQVDAGLERAVTGAADDPDYLAAWPAGTTVQRAQLAGRRLSVDLGGDALRPARRG